MMNPEYGVLLCTLPRLASTVGGKMQQQVRSHRNSLKPHNLKTIKQQLNVGVQ